MAQNFVPKQTAFVTAYAGQVQVLLASADQLALLNTEFTNDTFGSGGAQALTDMIVQSVLPGATAALFFTGEADVVTVLSSIASVRGALETFKVS
jgi:hypothetical protein